MNKKRYSNYDDLFNDIKQEKFYNIYLFYGKENYLKENIIKKMTYKLIDPSCKSLNFKTFYGETVLINEMVNEIETLPFISKYKLIILKEAERMNKIKKEQLINYLNQLNSTNDFSKLIIIYKVDKPAQNIIEIINKLGVIVNFDTVDKHKINIWITSKFKNTNKHISPDALYYLKSMTNSNLYTLFNEIEKIDIYTKNKKVINKEDIAGAIGGSEALNIFKVLDFIGEKDMKNALNGITKLNNSNLHHLSILAMIHRQIKLIFQTKLLGEEGADFKKIKEKLKLPHFIIEKIIRQSKKYTFKELCKAYELLNKADLELKDSYKNPPLILEELVMNIIGIE